MDKARRDEQEAYEIGEDMKRKIHQLSLNKKFYLKAAQIKLKRNRSSIAAAKLRNQQLRSKLNDLREKERMALGVNDLHRMQKRVCELEDYHNALLNANHAKRELLAKRKTDAQMAVIECKDVLDQNTPPLQKCRVLGDKCVKAKTKLEKSKESDAKCTKELKPMLDERTIFDAQVDMLARNVTKKHQEFDELMFMYHDATRTRELARGQLHQLLQRNFEQGTRFSELFAKPTKGNNKEAINQLEDTIKQTTERFEARNMKDLYLSVIELQRKRVYMTHYVHELKEMVGKLKEGGPNQKSLREKAIKLKKRIIKSAPVAPKPKPKHVTEEHQNTHKEKEPEVKETVVQQDTRGPQLFREGRYKTKMFKMIKSTQRLLETIQDGKSYNSENESVNATLQQLEQKLSFTLQGLKKWTNEMKEEKAKEYYARMHRTTMLVKDTYEKRIAEQESSSSHPDEHEDHHQEPSF